MLFKEVSTTNCNSTFLVRLHGEYNTSLALWKHHVNFYYCKASDPQARMFISANNVNNNVFIISTDEDP